MAVPSTGRGSDAVSLRSTGWVGAAARLLLVLASPPPLAAAEDDPVVLNPPSAAADSDVVLSFSVGTACGAGPPAAIAIDMPEGVIEVRPHAMDGWRLTVEEGALAYVYPHRGSILSSAVRRASWTRAGAETVETTVVVAMRLTDFPVGEGVVFPVAITCPDTGSGRGGAEVRANPSLTIAAPPRRRY